MRLRVGNDLDGCQSGFVEGCNLIRVANGEPEFPIGDWEFYKGVGMTGSEFVAWCHKYADAGNLFANDPWPESKAAYDRIVRLPVDVVIATDRSFGSHPSVSQRLTVEWLDKHDYYYDELIFTADKTVANCDMFVEDKLENYDALINADTLCYLINRPWNADPVKGFEDGRNRINHMSEYADAVEKAVADLGLYLD